MLKISGMSSSNITETDVSLIRDFNDTINTTAGADGDNIFVKNDFLDNTTITCVSIYEETKETENQEKLCREKLVENTYMKEIKAAYFVEENTCDQRITNYETVKEKIDTETDVLNCEKDNIKVVNENMVNNEDSTDEVCNAKNINTSNKNKQTLISSVQAAGPVRNRRKLARQNRHYVQRQIVIAPQALEIWRRIGADWGLKSDNDIAHLLLQRYEDSIAGLPLHPPPPPRCAGCGEPLLPLPCNICGPNRYAHRISRDQNSKSDQDTYCGRCRN